jgi:hypothetical protein
MRGWIGEWQRPLMGAAAATAAVIAISMAWGQHGRETSSPAVAVSAPVAQVEEAGMADIAEMEDEDFSIPLDSLDHMDALVAREDTSSLTDAEIQFLLY